MIFMPSPAFLQLQHPKITIILHQNCKTAVF